MSDHEKSAAEIHGELVDVLNNADVCLSCKLTALAVTVGMAILSRPGRTTEHFRIAAAFNKDLTTVLADNIDHDRGDEAIDQIKKSIGDIGMRKGRTQ